MSTNPVIRSSLERLMDKAVRLAVAGRTEEAEVLYSQVRQTEANNPSDLYQVARAWVNSGVVWQHQGLNDRAKSAWQKVLAEAPSTASGPLLGAIFKAAEYLALQNPLGQRAGVLAPYVRRVLVAEEAELHCSVWDLWAGAPELSLGEAPPGESGLHPLVPQLTRWSRLFWGTLLQPQGFGTEKTSLTPYPSAMTSAQVPRVQAAIIRSDLADFAVFYETLAYSLRKKIASSEAFKIWCQALRNSSFAPFPLTREEELNTLEPLSNPSSADLTSRSASYPSPPLTPIVQRITEPEIPFSSIRELVPFSDGWSWVHENGTVVWKTRQNDQVHTQVFPGSQHIIRAVSVHGGWYVQGDSPMTWRRLSPKLPLTWETFSEASEPQHRHTWSGQCAGDDGVWSWTTEGEIWFWQRQEAQPRFVGTVGPGRWTLGTWSKEWGLVLGGQDGRLARWTETCSTNKAHRSAVSVLMATAQHLLSVSEDGQLLHFQAPLGWQKPGERSLPKVTLGAVMGNKVALASMESVEVGDLTSKEWSQVPTANPTAVALRADGVVLTGEARGCVLAEQRIWGWSDWPVVLKDHGQKREWAAGGLDGSVRLVTYGKKTRLISWGTEPIWGWKAWAGGIASFSPFQLSLERHGQKVSLLELESALTAWTVWEDWLVVGDWSGNVFAFEAKYLTQVWRLKLSEIPVAFSGEGGVLRIATRAGSFYQVEMQNGQLEPSYHWGKGPVAGVSWSRSWVVIWGPRGLPCLVLEAQSGRAVTEFEPTRGVAAVHWDNNRLWLAEGNGRVALWDVQKATLIQTLWEQGDIVRQFVGSKRNLGVLTTGKRPGLLQRGGVAEFQWLGSHKRPLTTLALTPDGQELWSAGEDQGIRRWRLPEGEPLSKIEYPGIIEQLTFVENSSETSGLQFFASCRGGTVIVGSGPGGRPQ